MKHALTRRQTDDVNSDALRASLRAVRDHLNMPLSYISFFVDDDVFFKEVSSDVAKPILTQGERRPAEGTYCNAVLTGALPEFIPDTRANAYAMAMPVTHNAPVGAIVSVPLRTADDRIFGMFCCLSHEPRPDLTKRDHKTMELFAGIAQDTIRNAVMFTPQHDVLRHQIGEIIHNRAFDTVLQPIFDLHSRRAMGAEALTRFHANPYRSPDVWFADAEQIGMRQELEEVVFTQAIELLDKFTGETYLSVNISPDVLLNANLESILCDRDCSHLLIEITEHSKIKDMRAVKATMDKLRAFGVKFAIDDLGAGYSGLSTILRLKPEVLKMDRSLVSNIHKDSGSRALAKSLVYFARKIGARLIAEGIELEDEASQLDDIGVTYGQGYLLARPASAQVYFMNVA